MVNILPIKDRKTGKIEYFNQQDLPHIMGTDEKLVARGDVFEIHKKEAETREDACDVLERKAD